MRRKTFIFLLLAGNYLPVQSQTCSGFVGGYIPSWRDPTTVDYTRLTHVFYAFAKTNNAGDLIVDNPPVFGSFNTASVGKQRFLSISGGGDMTVAAMANSPTARQAFVSNCLSFCQAQSLQGIDVDWEGIITAQDSTNYGALMRALSTALHSQGLQLTATVAFGSYGGDYYNVGALKEADWIQLMVYDQTGSWADSPFGNHSTYQHVLNAVAYWVGRGYSQLSNIVIGLPFYGYRFNSTQGGLATGMSYQEIVTSYPGMSCDLNEVGLIVFNSPDLIRRKVRYVIDNGLKGVMIWEMGQDMPSTDKKSLLRAVSLSECDLPAACDLFVTTGLDDSQITDSFRLFPVPMSSTLNILADHPSSDGYQIELVNPLGLRLAQKATDFSGGIETIDVSDLASGVYYVRIIDPNLKNYVRKVVKIQ